MRLGRILALAALALLAWPLAPAQAGFRLGINIGIPLFWPAPPPPRPVVYVAPQPVYVAPQPVYVVPAQQPVYQAPRPVYVQPPPQSPPPPVCQAPQG